MYSSYDSVFPHYFGWRFRGRLHAPGFEPRRKYRRHPFNRRLGEPQSRCGVQKKISCPCRESNHVTFPQYPLCNPSSKCVQIMRQNVLFVKVNHASRQETFRWEGPSATYFGYVTVYDHPWEPHYSSYAASRAGWLLWNSQPFSASYH